MYPTKRRSARWGRRAAACVEIDWVRLVVEKSGAGRRECETRPRHHPGRAQFGPILSPIVAASGKTPITTLGKTAAQRLCRDGEACRRTLRVQMAPRFFGHRHGCTLGEAVPRSDHPTPVEPDWASCIGRPRCSPGDGALPTELERGARLYRAPGQLSISQGLGVPRVPGARGGGWGWVGPNAVRRPGLACGSSGTGGGWLLTPAPVGGGPPPD